MMHFHHHKKRRASLAPYLLLGAVVICAIGAAAYFMKGTPTKRTIEGSAQNQPINSTSSTERTGSAEPATGSPLSGLKFYRDPEQNINRLVDEYTKQGKTDEVRLLQRISEQPSAIWLLGQQGADAVQVKRATQAAAPEGTTPLFLLYAIPQRDACAGYSRGGFVNADEYLNWVRDIVAALETKSVFVVEPDALGHAVDGCLGAAETQARYTLLRQTVQELAKSSKVAGVYIDSAHSEWFPDSSELVEPLKKAGIADASGIAVNISNFVATPIIRDWATKLVGQLGQNKGVLIDTSRNGRGAVDVAVTGEARWCNPRGRGIGQAPTTQTLNASVHAYFWGKKPGESDGACFGFPAAGTLVPELALELAQNAED